MSSLLMKLWSVPFRLCCLGYVLWRMKSWEKISLMSPVTMVTTQLNHNLQMFCRKTLFLCHSHPPSMFVLAGRVKRSGIALLPPPPPPPHHPLTLHYSEVKSTWGRGWSTRRRATLTPATHHGSTAGPQTEPLEITRATTQSEAEAVDL